MRVVSWTVVLGSVTALLLTSLSPWLSEFRLPEVDRGSVAGTLTAADERSLAQEQSVAERTATCDLGTLEPQGVESCAETVKHSDSP